MSRAGSVQQRTVALSLTVSALNCVKYGWKLYKAADDAGLTLSEYFKYLLLLKASARPRACGGAGWLHSSWVSAGVPKYSQCQLRTE